MGTKRNINLNILLAKNKYKKTINPGHNVLALFNNLADVLIPASKTICDIYYNKLGIRVASRVFERLKT